MHGISNHASAILSVVLLFLSSIDSYTQAGTVTGNDPEIVRISPGFTTIHHGPTPLEIYSDWLYSVAPGQWLDLVMGSDDPLKNAERVEVSFEQGDNC